MKHKTPISDDAKQTILSMIIDSQHRRIIDLDLSGYSYMEIANMTYYSVRQIQRIIPKYYRELTIIMAEQKQNKFGECNGSAKITKEDE